MTAWRESYQTKKGVKYRVRWRENGTKKNRKAGFIPSTVNKLIKKVEDDLVFGTSLKTLSKVMGCYKEYIGVISKTLRPRTVAIAETSLKLFVEKFGNMGIDEIKSEDIEKFKNSLLETRQTNGINIIIRNIKTFLYYCVRNGYLTVNVAQPIKQFKVVPVARFLTREEMTALYRASSKKLRRAIFIFYNSGLRLGEFLSIQPQNLSDHGVEVKGKTGTRVIPIAPRVMCVLKGQAGEWHRKSLEQAFRIASRGARMGRVRIHDLRHTWASAYLQSGGTIADLQSLGGWTSLKTLQIYAHFQKHYLAERMIRVRL